MLRKSIKSAMAFLGLVLADIVILTVSFFSLYLFRITKQLNLPYSITDVFNVSSLIGMPNFDAYLKMYFFLVGVSLFFLIQYQAYHVMKRETPLDEFTRVFRAVSYSVIIAIGATFAYKIPYFSRFVFFAYWFAAILLLWMWRVAIGQVVVILTRHGFFKERLLIIGAGKIGQRVIDELTNNKSLGYHIIGLTDDDSRKQNDDYRGIPILGNNDEIDHIICSHKIDQILITIPSERNLINAVITKTRRFNVKIRVIPEMYDMIFGGVEVGQLGPIPYMDMLKTPMRGWKIIAKRLFDFTVSMFGLILLAPFLALVALLIVVDNPGPVIFKQQRVGKNGRIFDFYKFRSMIVDAEQLQAELASANEADGPVFKIQHDPRITRVGRFIRKYSIDELPQLYNVFKGEMSLVGPRPPLPQEVEQYGEWEWRRLEVTPGITCIWQVSGRSNISFDKWMELDVYYIENWSLLLDLQILLRTAVAVFRGTGAY